MVGGVTSVPWIPWLYQTREKMTREELVAAVDEEISRLEKVRDLLQTSGGSRIASS